MHSYALFPLGYRGGRGLLHNVTSVRVLTVVVRSRQVYIELVVETLLVILSYTDVTSDLSTQCLSGQQQTDSTLETGNHMLTEVIVSISKPK